MSLLICTATTKELSALAPSIFPNPESLAEMQPMQGNIKSGSAIFLVTGVGPINTAFSMGVCLGLTHPTANNVPVDAIIYAGLAGGFNLDVTPLCSIWRVSSEIWPEYGLNDGTQVTARAFSYPQWQRADDQSIYEQIDLADLSEIASAKKKGEPWPSCRSLTVAGVTASFARRTALWEAWHVELENMEGFAAGYAAARAGIPLVEIRVISNKVGPRNRHEKDFDGALNTLSSILPDLNLL